MAENEQLSNTEIKNFIEHSLKIIMANFDERLSSLESKITDLTDLMKSSVNTSQKISKTITETPTPEPKEEEFNLKDALRLIEND